MKNLRIESRSVHWEHDEKQIVIEESFLVKGVKHVPHKKLVMILAGERGEASDLLAYREDGTFEFSLCSPLGYFYYFAELSNGLGVTCGRNLYETELYTINFQTKCLELDSL